jgi:hypothetical protein
MISVCDRFGACSSGSLATWSVDDCSRTGDG